MSGTIREALENASFCLAKDDLDGAKELCTAAVRTAPRNARARYLLGAIAQLQGRGKEAAEHARQAARLRPDVPSLQIAAGSLLYREKAFAQALQLYEAAIETYSPGNNAQYHLGAASALRKLGRNERATEEFLKASDASPRDAHVQYKLGQHLRSIGDGASAGRAYARALELNPGHALAAFWLSATRKLTGGRGPNATDSKARSTSTACSGSCLDARDAEAAVAVAMAAPPMAPREYVVGLYNCYAKTFDAHLQGALAYRTPSVIVETLASLFPGKRWKRCLDLGCGTGLSGLAASDICDQLVGIDLSPAMVRQAREKRVYHRLLVGDITEAVLKLCGNGTQPPSGCHRCCCLKWDVPLTKEEAGGAPNDRDELDLGHGTLGSSSSCCSCCSDGGDGGGDGVQSSATPALENPERSGGAMPLVLQAEGGDNGGDLVLSCDVFVYIGDLRACLTAVHDLVTKKNSRNSNSGAIAGSSGGEKGGAIFAFSAEASPHADVRNMESREEGESVRGRYGSGGDDDSPGYELQGTGRYTHSRGYLENLCRDVGFRVLAADDVVLRKNAGVPVQGFVFITQAIARQEHPVAPGTPVQ